MRRFTSSCTRLGTVVASLALLVTIAAAAVPPGYRYIGSRSVSEGRVVLWYWNVDYFEPGGSPVAFTARLYARAIDVNQERPYVAVVRCDSRSYKGIDDPGPFQTIDPGEPIHVVWRVGCANGVAVNVAERQARLSGQGMAAAGNAAPQAMAPTAGVASPAGAASVPRPGASPAGPANSPAAAPSPPAAGPRESPTTVAAGPGDDPRRADACLRFSDTRASPAGDATLTNACGFAIEVAVCYKGGGTGRFDCPTPPRGRHLDSLAAGVTHVLPEYRRSRHRGIAAVACRGGPGTVLPRLEGGPRGGCD